MQRCAQPSSHRSRLQFSADFLKDFAPSIAALTRRIRRLPPPNQATLKTLAEHLSKVVEHEQTTRMTASNLSMVFGPVVFGEDEAVTLESAQNTKKVRTAYGKTIDAPLLTPRTSFRTSSWSFSSLSIRRFSKAYRPL